MQEAIAGGEAFFAPLTRSGKAFLRVHWTPSIDADPIEVDEGRARLLGEINGQGIQIEDSSGLTKVVPRVIVTRVELTEQVPYSSLLSSEENILRLQSTARDAAQDVAREVQKGVGELLDTEPTEEDCGDGVNDSAASAPGRQTLNGD